MILLGEENHPEYNTKGVDGHIFLVKILSVHLGSGVVYVYHLNLAQNAFQCYQTTQSFTIKRHEKNHILYQIVPSWSQVFLANTSLMCLWLNGSKSLLLG